MDVEWIWNSFGIRGESIGNSYGIRLELICKSDGWFGNVLGMHRGCWEMSVEFIGNYYECCGKQLVFIGNPWDISGDFWLGIHSPGEVQIQTERIHTHAISLTKPRFPFHVLTGSGVTDDGERVRAWTVASNLCLSFASCKGVGSGGGNGRGGRHILA